MNENVRFWMTQWFGDWSSDSEVGRLVEYVDGLEARLATAEEQAEVHRKNVWALEDRLSAAEEANDQSGHLINEMNERIQRAEEVVEAAEWVINPNGSPHASQKAAIVALEAVLRRRFEGGQ